MFILDVDNKDAQNASQAQRKLVMMGCNKPWIHALRQISNVSSGDEHAADEH
jgi:hypothetical protein